MADGAVCYFNGEFIPLAEAKVSIMTHALNYGTGCFEGIRAYWNEDDQQLFILKLREHYDRLRNSCRILSMALPHEVDDLCGITTELVRRNNYRQDVYIRPLVYKSSEVIGVRLHGIKDGFAIFTAPMGDYINVEKGIRVCVSSWRRVDDSMIPARAKVTGIYINSALAKTEAALDGYDEAIMLTAEGHVSEGSAENLFLVENERLITPPVSDNILVGITRAAIMELAREVLGMPVVERSIDRSELYVAQECFLCGTGAQLSPVVEVDRRPVGSGEVGPVTAKLQRVYFDAVRGKSPKYVSWVTAVY